MCFLHKSITIISLSDGNKLIGIFCAGP